MNCLKISGSQDRRRRTEVNQPERGLRMARKPSPLGHVQQKIPVLILPEDFGVNEQEVKDCLAGLAAHEELCRERGDFDGWVKNRITDAMDTARAAGKAAREEREKGEAIETLGKHLEGVAKHYGMTISEVEEFLESKEEAAILAKDEKAKKKK